MKVQLLFSAISGMYGLQFLGLAIVQFKDCDMRDLRHHPPPRRVQIIEMILPATDAMDAGNVGVHLFLQEGGSRSPPSSARGISCSSAVASSAPP